LAPVIPASPPTELYTLSLHDALPIFIKDDEPLLFHTGMRGMFPEVREAISKLIDPATLRWISWSHFEVDECGALNEWLAVAPKADRKSTRLNSSHVKISYAVFCLKKK